jgi:hypothetical protein
MTGTAVLMHQMHEFTLALRRRLLGLNGHRRERNCKKWE